MKATPTVSEETFRPERPRKSRSEFPKGEMGAHVRVEADGRAA